MWSRFVLPCLFLLLVSPVSGAGSAPDSSKASAESAEFLPVDQMGSMIRKLVRSIDLWHDANLKGDRSEIANCERMIFEVLQADLDVSRDQWRKDRHAADSIGTLAVRKKVDEAESYVRVKERLVQSLRKANTFSSKYRLLSDYVDVLKMERRSRAPELAEKPARAASEETDK